ncbi:hypothetical protein HAX54_016285 [Datura stramonium]|uniref:Uncharacterized protein n=1 Tax=Datura stramonium TaxID=4076 RepID=A0ABS8S045_DATST|nr:hypothetical protein [Datura stramonium]
MAENSLLSSNLKHQFKTHKHYMNGGKNLHQTLNPIHDLLFFCHKAFPVLFWFFFIFSFSSIQSFGISRFLSEFGAALSNSSAFDNNGSFTSTKPLIFLQIFEALYSTL